MKFAIQSIRFLSIFSLASIASCSADASTIEDSCIFRVGDKYAEGCDERDTIDVINHRGYRSTFTKRRRSRRFWYGENEQGASLSYVRSNEGDIHGSLVDVEDAEVTQISVEQGRPIAITTSSSGFGEELEPPNAEESKTRKLSSTSLKFSSANKSNNREQLSSMESLRMNSTSSKVKKATSRMLNDNGDVLDVMVVWTKDAECRNAGYNIGCTLTESTASAMQATIDLAVEETNTAYELSYANTELLLVHSYQHPTYTASSFSEALYDIRDGDVDGVHDKREEYGADIVALIIDDAQYCGLAFLGPSIGDMYSVTAWNCATGYFSFGHEIGHNLGLNHDRGTESACNSLGNNYGYRDSNANYRSILAYSCTAGQCDNNPGGGCTRIIRFSNPSSEGYNGAPIGDSENNNSQRINDVRATVAAYYTHVLPSGPTISPLAPTISPAPTLTPTVCSGDYLTVELTTDQWAFETSWTVADGGGAIVMGVVAGDLSNGQTYTQTKCLSPDCYIFVIRDSYGDGICCSYGTGSFSVMQDGTQILSGGNFGSSANVGFCVEDEAPPTSSPTSAPTSARSLAPTSITCEDSTMRIFYQGNSYSCAQIIDNDACSVITSSHCPKSCDACEAYGCENSSAPLEINGNEVNCELFSNLGPDTISNYCAISSALMTTCRDTCDFCSI